MTAVSDPASEETSRQSKVKEMYAIDARQTADFVARNSMAGLADAISAERGSLIVLNTLNWKRSALVSFDLEKGREIVDSVTGATIPFEVVSESVHLNRVQFIASDVPAMGYKVFFAAAFKAVAASGRNQRVDYARKPLLSRRISILRVARCSASTTRN